MRKTDSSPPPHETCSHRPVLALIIFLVGAVELQDPPSTPPTPGELVVNEILYDPPDGQVEFIELYNRSERTIDLTSVRIADNRRQPVALVQHNRNLPPGGFTVIVQNERAFYDYFPDIDVLSTTAWPQLNNGGDIVLLFAGGALIDSVYYASNRSAPAVSLERVDPSTPSSDPDNWHPSTADRGSTPGRRNSVYSPDTTAPRILFAEETSPRTVLLHVSEPVIPAGLTAVNVSCGSDRQTSHVRQLVGSRRIELRLSDRPTAAECRVEGLEDPAGNRMSRTIVPLAYQPAAGDLVITEIMYKPLGDPYDDRPDQPEYIELYNRSETAITVRDLYWTDRPNEKGRADTTVVGRPRSAVSAGGYAVIYADPDATDGAVLRRAFPGPTPAICLLPVAGRTLGLRDSGETVRLHGSNHEVIDQLHYRPEWHHPDVVDSRGIALERITIDGSSDDASNWASSTAPLGGTPGRPNTLSVPAREGAPKGALRVEPSPFSPDGDGVDDHALIEYDLAHAVATLRVRIFDVNGHLVRTLSEVRLGSSSGTIVWDGRDDDARPLPRGIYIILLEVVDAAGGAIARLKTPAVIARSG